MTDIGPDHNIQIDPDAVIAFQIGKLKRAKASSKNAQGDLKAILNKLDASGLHTKAAVDALKIVDKGKKEETVEYIQKLLAYLRIMGEPLQKAQLDLFESGPEPQPLDEKAYADGLRAGRLDDPYDNPHDPNSESGRQWQAGFDKGQEERRLILAMETEEQDPEDLSEDDDDQSDIEDADMEAAE
jgi:hypothetical protein